MKKNIIIYILFILFLFILISCSDMLTYNPNRKPDAVISKEDYTIYPGIKINLKADKSSDVDNQAIRFVWKVISQPDAGSPYSLSDKYTDTAEFQTSYYSAGNTPYTAPNPTYIGTYRVKISVYDEYDMKDSEYIDVIVRNLTPTATILWTGAKPLPGDTVSLNGGTSVDPDPEKRNDLSFYWRVIDQPDGTVWAWNAGAYGTASFIPTPVTTTTVDFTPGLLGAVGGEGVYTVMLTVTDEYGLTDDVTTVIETLNNTLPTAAADVDVTNYGGPTVNACVDVDATPASITGAFVTGTGPLITLSGLPSDATGAARNYEQDTLTYTWTISGFVGTKSIQIGANTRDYTSGNQLSTASNFSFSLTDINDIVSDGNSENDFIITLTVSDGAKNDQLILNFDID